MALNTEKSAQISSGETKSFETANKIRVIAEVKGKQFIKPASQSF